MSQACPICRGLLSAYEEIVIDLLLGAPAASAFADASYFPEYPGSVEAGVWGNLSHALSWQGVAILRLVDGTPISQIALSASLDSGFDYSRAYVASVPEPSAAWLMVVGLLLLWRCVRKSNRKREGLLPDRGTGRASPGQLFSGQ